MDKNTEQTFRQILVVEPTHHDLSSLNRYSRRVRYLTSGFADDESISAQILEELRDFNPETDAIIPMGKLLSNILLGAQLARFGRVTVGIFQGGDVKDYIFKEVTLAI